MISVHRFEKEMFKVDNKNTLLIYLFTVNSTIECSSSTFLLRFEHKKHIAVFLILKISAGEVAFPTEVFTQNSYKRYRAPGY